ncbi:hypothetical protein QTP88_029027 [Uroleucon formosanum]
MVKFVQNIATTDIETNISVDLEEIQNECILFSDENETFDDTDKDPTFDPYCTIVEPSDDDDQATVPDDCEDQDVTVPDGDEVINTDINQNIYSGRPKKGKKRKYTEQSRANIKLLKNSNLSYYNYKNKKIDPKKFKDFDCVCPMKCVQKVSLEQRKLEFDNFWKIGEYTAQNAYIAALVNEIPIKRRINTALKKIHGRAPLLDQRGVKNGGLNKIHDEKLKIIKEHIDKIPKYKSHYCREQSSFQYLPLEMTLEKMYAAYKEENMTESVSFSSYKRFFYDNFNLKFKSLKKDTCNTCDTLNVQINNETNAIKKQELTTKHNEHLNLAENAQASLKLDLEKSKECENFQCLTYDMEKTLPLPRLPTNIIFYKRQLWLYNTGIYSGKEHQGYCYVWLEGQAGRGAQEVGSCLLKHIKNNLNNNIKDLVLWSDSCGGQNRNIKVVLLLKTLFNSTELDSITLKYLYPGHSFLPNDRNFSDIESALKHQQRLYTPQDYINVMRTCKKKNPLMVIQMNDEDFVSSEMLEKKSTNRKVSVSGDKINWLQVRRIKLCRNQPFSLLMSTTLLDENFLKINIEKRGRGRISNDILFPSETLLTKLWPNGKEINQAKLDDIKSIMHLIPADAQEFYTHFTGNSIINLEDVNGFNENLDFDIETNNID